MKRKMTILLNVALFVLAVGSIAFGVYAAQKLTLNIKGSVGFAVHDCDVDVTATIEGHTTKSNPDGPPKSSQNLITTNGGVMQIRGADKTLDLGDIMFSDMGKTGKPEDITIEITLTNKSKFDVLVDDIEPPTTPNDRIKVICLNNLAQLSVAPEAGATTTDHTTVVTYTLSLIPNEDGTYDNIGTAININFNLELSKMPTLTEAQLDLFTVNEDGAITGVPTVDAWRAAGGDANTLIIPATTSANTPVTGITGSLGTGRSAFWPLTNVDGYKQVVISKGISNIGTFTFVDCDNLTSISFPNTLTEVGTGTLAYCDSLKSVAFSDCVASAALMSLHLCSNLKQIYISNSDFGFNEYYYFGYFEYFNFDKVKFATSGEGYEFKDGLLTISSSTITDSSPWVKLAPLVTEIDLSQCTETLLPSRTFQNFINLTKITMPSTMSLDVNETNPHYYQAYPKTTRLETINYEKIGETYTFKNGELTINSTTVEDKPEWMCVNPLVTRVNWGSFEGNSIGEYAFYNCYSLTEIEIPESVTTIKENAFGECNFKNVKYTKNGSTYRFKDGLLTITSRTIEDRPEWQRDNIIPLITNVEISDISTFTGSRIGSYAFDGASLTQLVIPNGIEVIGENAFYRNYGLVNVSLPSSLKTMESNCFRDCQELRSITIPTSVNRISSYALFGDFLEGLSFEDTSKTWTWTYIDTGLSYTPQPNETISVSNNSSNAFYFTTKGDTDLTYDWIKDETST